MLWWPLRVLQFPILQIIHESDYLLLQLWPHQWGLLQKLDVPFQGGLHPVPNLTEAHVVYLIPYIARYATSRLERLANLLIVEKRRPAICRCPPVSNYPTDSN